MARLIAVVALVVLVGCGGGGAGSGGTGGDAALGGRSGGQGGGPGSGSGGGPSGGVTAKADMPTARFGLASATVNGIVYAIGGADFAISSTNPHLSTVEAYDPATNHWSTKAALPTARSGLAATAVNGIIY